MRATATEHTNGRPVSCGGSPFATGFVPDKGFPTATEHSNGRPVSLGRGPFAFGFAPRHDLPDRLFVPFIASPSTVAFRDHWNRVLQL